MLHIDKNVSANVEIIQMSYLKYLYSLFLTFATNGEFSLLESFQNMMKEYMQERKILFIKTSKDTKSMKIITSARMSDYGKIIKL